MAAIAGLLHADPDHPIDRDAAETLMQRVAGNAGGDLERWTSGAVHLVGAGQDASNLRDGHVRLKIVGDVRLDARATLAASLGLDPSRSPDIALIAAAYERWGPDCARRMIGDFAFAVWDEEKRQLFCARDSFGVRPLYYRQDHRGFAFASRLNVLAQSGDAVSKAHIACYLAGIDDSHEETAFAAMRRLPMEHWLLWSPGRLRIERYATIAADPVSPHEDFVRGFRERFLTAVDDRARATPNLGAMLSGGLDSSSIVSALARREGRSPLSTFSFAYPRSAAYDEREYAAAVVSKYDLAARDVDMESIAPLDGVASLADGNDDLFFAPGLPKIVRLLSHARQAGVRVMLDGHGGDEVVSHGFGRLTELARERRWLSLYRELRGVRDISGESTIAMFFQFYTRQGVAAMARRWIEGRARARQPLRPGEADLPVLDAGFVRESGLQDRLERWTLEHRRTGRSEQSQHLWSVTSPPVARALETLRRAGDEVGVELRFPFYDRRLVTYALAVPDREKLKDGWPRSILRRAMDGILPAKVQWRRSKVDFGSELSEGLVRHHSELLHEMLRDGAAVGEYVDLPAARRSVARLIASPQSAGLEFFAIWRVAFLALWLDSRRASVGQMKVLS